MKNINIYITMLFLSGIFSMVSAQSPLDISIWVNGACGHCKERIEKVANNERGVKDAEWDQDSKILQLEVNDKFELDKLHIKLAEVGHDTKLKTADDNVYEALPACCHYREETDHDAHQDHMEESMMHEENEHEENEHEENEHEIGDEHYSELDAHTENDDHSEDKASEIDPHAGHNHAAETSSDSHDAIAKTSKKASDPNEHNHIGGIINGRVVEKDGDHLEVLMGANVYWTGTSKGVITDENGLFEIPVLEGAHYLVISYVGYGKDSVHIHEPTTLEIEFNKARALEEVKVVYRVAATTFDLGNPFNMQEMHEKELLKCACCNLSESFETNPAVDVSVTDAVTGTKQIEMLGLAGQYVQITRENMPHVRGLASIYGFSYVPGSWIEGIQLNTGVGTVVNGFESMTGQINVEMKKPVNNDKLFFNLFGSTEGMMEANLNLTHVLNEKWSTALLLHAKNQSFEFDHNGDGFMDHPAVKTGIFLHRWSYVNDEGLNLIMGLKGTYALSEAGQIDFDHEQDYLTQSNWGSGINTNRWEVWAKIGKVFIDKPNSSIGFQISGTIHDQSAFFGRRTYDAKQQSLYSNLIYMNIIGNTNHQYRTGISFQADSYNEDVLTRLDNGSATNFLRKEIVPGAFFEYSYNYLDKFTVVSGLRADYHNEFGLFVTPRLHLRYAPTEKTAFRAMIGKGQKTANIFAENIGMFASSRNIVIESTDNDASYGFEPEVAWNTGVSLAQEFQLAERKGVVKVDYYYTWFVNQIIANYDRSTDAVYIQSLDGQSYSGSLQAQINYELFKSYDIRLAYRHNDVRSTIDGELLPEALTPKHRAFLNMAYETERNWVADMTLTWQGMKRIPGTSTNPEEFQLETYSPHFFLWNGQITKKLFDNKLDIYAGAENILNYRQDNPIIDAENPFGDYFDASMIWGPVFGRKMYVGLRMRL